MKRIERNEAEKKVLKMLIDTGITQKMVAEYLDVTPQAVRNRLERGKVEPILEAIRELDKKLPEN